MISGRTTRSLRLVALTGVAALAMAACGGSSSSSGGSTGGSGGSSSDTMVFGASRDPVTLDGAYVSDGESIRAIRQIFDTLVTTAPGKTDIVPLLAEKWTTSADGKTWTFTLKKGAKFSDGTDFDGKAVCTNFDRWYNFKGIQQSPNVSYYWQTVFGGYAANEDKALGPSLYASCSAPDAGTSVVTLTKPSSTFLSALSLPAFSIASPKALTDYKADAVSGSADSPQFTGTFGSEHPIGTGAFVLKSWERGNQLVLERNDNYWGTKAKLKTLVLKPIADGPARRQALESGDIDGYDLVAPADIKALEAKYQILLRPAFNVGYIGFNQAMPPMDNLKIRQAVAYAINRANVIKTNYPTGAVVAQEFQPPEVFGYAKDVTQYPYDPAKAKQLIAESGVTNPKIEFWFPTDISRPYMPDASANFQLMKADLEKAGFTIVTKQAPWSPDFLDAVDGGRAQMYLIGWTGDFGDPDNFVGTFFQAPTKRFGFQNKELFALLAAAEAEPNPEKRTQMYEEANKTIMDFLPGLPYVHTQPALAFKKNVQGFVPSPVSGEDFSTVSFSAG